MDQTTREYNRDAWNGQVTKGNVWTQPVTTDQVDRARRGDWEVVLTPTKPVPRSWFPSLEGAQVLGLACGGGQQGPLLAAAGARVTILDNSPGQLAQDRMVSERDGLGVECIEGDMAEMSTIGDDRFDLVFHPVSNCFVEDVLPVWREAFRVLRPGGVLLAGVCNPVMYLFDDAKMEKGELVVRHRLPYSDLTSISVEERQRYIDNGDPLSFGHTLDDQIGGQLAAGFLISGFFEDYWRDADADPLALYMPTFIATRAVKPPIE